ncbi:uncharacterized protein EV420DRAFT_229265 [Desarmillaria tabescens]|uniref:RING-CH-type domain-containing protein n=1 Tax=Armillaria tabescens TaxID=1929756 RepID=A0AA39TJ35_ARMTA|nr:uncharacterized protein EV420DRAFT_229265 [Desarmillaria tabescens]KAK0460737.1 hypothetical protein EV420DRAFT_229265 [Desarmillaria tabescens]
MDANSAVILTAKLKVCMPSFAWCGLSDITWTGQCYLCRQAKGPNDAWVHPCDCNVVAHQRCLLVMIDRLPMKPPACPKCKFVYETTESMILPLQLLRSGQETLNTAIHVVAVVAFGKVSWLAWSYVMKKGRIYIFKRLFGKTLFNLLLTDNMSNWSVARRLAIPLIYILSREPSRYRHFLFMALFTWPSQPPLAVRERLMTNALQSSSGPGLFPFPSNSPPSSMITWPPTRAQFGCLIYATSFVYDCFRSRVLGLPTRPDLLCSIFSGARHFWHWIRHLRDREGWGAYIQLDWEVDFTTLEMLLLPVISQGMGRLLYTFAGHVPFFRFCLGIKAAVAVVGVSLPLEYLTGEMRYLVLNDARYWTKFTTWAWTEMDAVWIRNTVGLGLYVVMKDTLGFFYRRIIDKETETSRIVDRPFEGLDLRQWDLVSSQPDPNPEEP